MLTALYISDLWDVRLDFISLCEAMFNMLGLVKDALRKTVEHKGEVFGASEIECGNYRSLDLQLCRVSGNYKRYNENQEL